MPPTIIQDYEYKSNQQVNISLGESFKMAVKAPAIADRIFSSYNDANKYIHDDKNSAIQGLILTVLTGNDNKGVYYVDGIQRNAGYIDDFGHVYNEGEIELVLIKVYIHGDTTRQSDWSENNQFSDSYVKNRPNITDNVDKNTISLVGRVDFVNGMPKVTRSLINSEDGIIKLNKGNMNYVLYGTIQPSIRITWVEYNPEQPQNIPNSFTDFETAEMYFSDKDKTIYPEYIRCGNIVEGYMYYYLSFERINFNVNVDEETIIKDTKTSSSGETINFLRINVPKLKISDYNMLEDDSYIKNIKFKTNKWYQFKYVEVSYSEYEEIKFKELISIPEEINIESYRFIKVDNSYYIKSDFELDDVSLLNDGQITNEMMSECIFMLNGILYETIVINNTVNFIQKTITDKDNLIKSIETIEKLIYFADLGKY